MCAGETLISITFYSFSTTEPKRTFLLICLAHKTIYPSKTGSDGRGHVLLKRYLEFFFYFMRYKLLKSNVYHNFHQTIKVLKIQIHEVKILHT